ncbi:hypothetical protein E3A20_23300 [Planctomyces bekefii]|uniref:Uncharacterized protein n=1 Tax=Planctomyces bekefii TaxID=1653850 RepID=A0A5C6M1C3_9PLAN|nr:hypothetical protein E3A20_23300 [Planctomyces bekefii]
MRVTPLEALEIWLDLKAKGQTGPSLEQKLEAVIERFRLDQGELSDGRHEYLRRTYTCPFYKDTNLGCGISPTLKPLGCLAFNPLTPGIVDGGACAVHGVRLAEATSGAGAESRSLLNLEASQWLQATWEKLPIPLAVLAWERSMRSADGS